MYSAACRFNYQRLKTAVAISTGSQSAHRKLLNEVHRREVLMLLSAFDYTTARMLEGAGFDKSQSPMWVFDMESLYFLAVNEAAIRLYGYSREEFLSMTILDIRPAEDIAPLLREHILVDKHESERAPWRHRKKNGDLIRVEITSHATISNRRRVEIVTVTPITSLGYKNA